MTGPVAVGPNIDDDSQWIFPKVDLTEIEKRLIVATVVEIGVKTVFRTHVYQFGGRTFQQQQGGPIGLWATGAIARIVMAEWDAQLVKLLSDNGLTYEDAARYVDDFRAIMKAIKLGWRWNGKELEFREEWKTEDEREGLTKSRKTARVMNAMMDSIMKGMKFTMEIGEDFEDNTLPTLDTRLWIEEEQIRYSFYEKPMSNRQVVHNNSAMGENSKIASLSQELIRRLKNTSVEIDQGNIDEIINNFSVKLVSS